MNIKVKRLTETAKLPTKAHDTDACFDLYVDEPELEYIWINEGCSFSFHTGISTEIPRGYFCAIFARSGLGIKKNLRPSNCVGIIDSDNRGEWLVNLINDGKTAQCIQHGDRVSQFCILPVLDFDLVEVEHLSDTDRGSGGFGSTGN